MADESSGTITKRQAIHRASCAKYRAKMTEQDKERHNARCNRAYYIKKGRMPREKSSLGRFCKERGYSLEAVMSGEQPI
jgi:hypothetical protein